MQVFCLSYFESHIVWNIDNIFQNLLHNIKKLVSLKFENLIIHDHALMCCISVFMIACEQALKLNWEPASMTNEFEYLPRNVRFSKYGMSILIWCCLQLSVQTKFRPYSLYCFLKYKIFKQKFKCFKYFFLKTEHFVLWDKMAKTNLIS
jgi:hypothetical protein